MQRILHYFWHGIGDAVMFTAVLRHLQRFRPDWTNDVAALKGKHSAFYGLAGKSYLNETPDHLNYDQIIEHDWPECSTSWADSPGTKTTLCLRERFGIQPDWELLTYHIVVGDQARDRVDAYIKTLPIRPLVLLHYQGNTFKGRKDLSHQVIVSVCNWLIERNYTPVILDWDRRSPVPDQKTVFSPGRDNPLWMDWGTGDAETLAALIDQAALFIGIDSGPCKIAFATKTPTVSVWVSHHPYHYCDNAPNAVHLVPDNHTDYLRGDKGTGLDFFAKHFSFVTYQSGHLASAMMQLALVSATDILSIESKGKPIMAVKAVGS